MRALQLSPGSGLTLRDVPTPSPAGECLIRVTIAGICGTDLQMLDGYADFTGIPGHEFVGVVEASRMADVAWRGRRVVGEINVGCGECDWCARGEKEHCPQRTVVGIRDRNGAFAEYLTLPAANLHAVPDGMPDEVAVFTEPVAAACRILEQLRITGDTRIAVVGDGRLGNLTAQVLRTRTPHVTLIGRHDRKMAIAREAGIDARREDDVVGETFDVVVDATGRAEGLQRALSLVRPRGTIVLKSTTHGAAAVPLWPVPVHEIAVVGSRCGPFAPALDLLKSGAGRTAPLVAATFPLEEWDRAIKAARGQMKILLKPGA